MASTRPHEFGETPQPEGGSGRSADAPAAWRAPVRAAAPRTARNAVKDSFAGRAWGQKGPAPRVLVYTCSVPTDDPAFALLKDEGVQVVSCNDGQNLLEQVVYAFRTESAQDLGVLHLLRRVAPDLPLVLLATEGSLEVQRLVQNLRPIYYAVTPVEPSELRDAVHAALARQARLGG
jgi:hypothetical protein